MTTISDVARLASVSPSTVSHVINGTRFVSKATEEAVRNAIAETGYTVNTIARALARSTSNSIGVAVPAIANSYFSEIARAIEVELAAHQISVFLVDTADDPVRELRQIRALHQHRVDGIIMAPMGKGPDSAMHYLHLNGVPTVLIDRMICAGMDQVGIENRKATKTLFSHLAGLGHRSIGFIPGQPGVKTTEDRVAGFEEAVAEHAFPSHRCPQATACATIEEASLATRMMMRSADRPTALIGGNNVSTLGIMKGLRLLSLRVPEDVALVSFDDFDWADSFEPQLTVLRQPAASIGHTAAGLLLDRIRGTTRDPVSLNLDTEFIIRRSCGGERKEGQGMTPPPGSVHGSEIA